MSRALGPIPFTFPNCLTVGTTIATPNRSLPAKPEGIFAKQFLKLALTKTCGHGFKILRLPLSGPALLPRRRYNGGGAIEVGYLGGRRRIGYGGCRRLQGYRAGVRVLGVHRVVRMRRRVMMMMMMEELGRRKGRLARIVRRVDRNRRALSRMQLGAHLVVQPTEHGAISHAEVVALR